METRNLAVVGVALATVALFGVAFVGLRDPAVKAPTTQIAGKVDWTGEPELDWSAYISGTIPDGPVRIDSMGGVRGITTYCPDPEAFAEDVCANEMKGAWRNAVGEWLKPDLPPEHREALKRAMIAATTNKWTNWVVVWQDYSAAIAA